ncbi:uncharacterized protein LOC142768588 [Rhipicephalus microplus]|uniref:uncharacterized protein LOC142768588 n=1 Tax=Rhipicephalus microplus TaxID=6941 RepID=UPI003F6B8B95
MLMQGCVWFVRGLLFVLSTLNQEPTYVLAGVGGQAKDPLYEHPRRTGNRWRLPQPSLPRIPEEESGPRRRDGWDQILENPNIVGIGDPPITRFLFHPRDPFLQGLWRHGPPPRGQQPRLPRPRVPQLPPLQRAAPQIPPLPRPAPPNVAFPAPVPPPRGQAPNVQNRLQNFINRFIRRQR